MSRRMVVAAATVVLATPVAVASVFVPAEASQGCVTLAEYNKVSKGMTAAKVHRIFGTNGEVLFHNPGIRTNMARTYQSCAALAQFRGKTVQIQYNNYRGSLAMKVVYKQVYR